VDHGQFVKKLDLPARFGVIALATTSS